MTNTLPGRSLRFIQLVTASALALVLTACGGGGGGSGVGSGFNSTPPPSPPPPPTPPPPPQPNYAKIFPNITASTDFAVLGLEASSIPSSVSSLATSGFSVRYDAAVGAYIFDFPSTEPTNFETSFEDANFWGSWLKQGTNWPGFLASVAKPDQLALSYTSYVTYYDYDYDDYAPVGFAAFGTATPASGVPTTGSATYQAHVAGQTLDRHSSVSGTASLQFNFGAGTLSGNFNPSTYNLAGSLVSLGTYNFVNTVFGVGSTTFSGRLERTGAPQMGSFNGLFTGPAAQELMSRWTAPYLNPDNGQWSEMFGVWVGKKP